MVKRLNFDTYVPSEDESHIEVALGPPGDKTVFHAYPMVAGIDLLDLVTRFDADSEAEAGKAILQFFKASMMDWDAFHTYISDKKNMVDFTTLTNIAFGLAEEYMGEVPTESAESSSNGSAKSGSGSKGKQSSKASRSKS